MITPSFKLTQNDDFLFIDIKAPYAKLTELDIYIDENDFRFYCKPYFLRLHLPGSILENNDDVVYDFEESLFKLKFEKKISGEPFEGLDFITKLLTPVRKKTPPLIQEIAVKQEEEIAESNENVNEEVDKTDDGNKNEEEEDEEENKDHSSNEEEANSDEQHNEESSEEHTDNKEVDEEEEVEEEQQQETQEYLEEDVNENEKGDEEVENEEEKQLEAEEETQEYHEDEEQEEENNETVNEENETNAIQNEEADEIINEEEIDLEQNDTNLETEDVPEKTEENDAEEYCYCTDIDYTYNEEPQIAEEEEDVEEVEQEHENKEEEEANENETDYYSTSNKEENQEVECKSFVNEETDNPQETNVEIDQTEDTIEQEDLYNEDQIDENEITNEETEVKDEEEEENEVEPEAHKEEVKLETLEDEDQDELEYKETYHQEEEEEEYEVDQETHKEEEYQNESKSVERELEEDEDDGSEWYIEQTVNNDNDLVLNINSPKYGFAQTKSNVFSRLSEEYQLVIDLPDPDNNREDRTKQRTVDESKKFDDDHYLADYFDDSETIESTILSYTPNYDEQENSEYTDAEIDILKNMPKRTYLLDKQEKFYAFSGLIDILFAYCYNRRINCGEANVESGWTIAKLSSTLSWFDTFKSLQDVLVASYRRSLCFPLYRNWKLTNRVYADLVDLLKQGQKQIIKTLLNIRKSFLDKCDNRYILNDLYINDYIVWIQYVNKKRLNSLITSIESVKISKQMVDFDLECLEICGQLALEDANRNESDDEFECQTSHRKSTGAVSSLSSSAEDEDYDETEDTLDFGFDLNTLRLEVKDENKTTQNKPKIVELN